MIEIGNYRGFAYIVKKDIYKISYEWDGKSYLRFYDLRLAIDCLLGVMNEN